MMEGDYTMKYCKGCLSITKDCFYSIFGEEFKCPCNICLIKMTCAVGCNDFGHFTLRYTKGRDTIKLKLLRKKLNHDAMQKM